MRAVVLVAREPMHRKQLGDWDRARAATCLHTCGMAVQQRLVEIAWVVASMSGTISRRCGSRMCVSHLSSLFLQRWLIACQVSEMAEEQELRDMFERFGRVLRVFLAKDRETGMAKGFAFVSYQERSDAAKACEKMDGYGFKHLILRVEFAKKAT